ncbi:MAG: response regulator [Muribaculaceae bacterium]|nr:response regulator [Muribaculaceae bacterium]
MRFRKMLRIVYIILLMTVYAVSAGARQAAPGNDLKFRHYTTEEGLPSNCIRDIVQDRTGFVWFATDGGLVRYDGKRFRTFEPVCCDSCGCGRYAMSLAVYKDNILVGTDKGLQFYDAHTERLTPIIIKDSLDRPVQIEGNVRDVLVDRRGDVWLSIDGNGIFQISNGCTLKQRYEFPECSNYLSMMLEDSAGELWAVSSLGSGLLYRYDRGAGTFRPFSLTIDGRPTDTAALCVWQDNSGRYWLGTWNNGVLCFDARNGHAVRMLSPSQCHGAEHIHSMTSYGDGYMLIGSDGGLWRMNMTTGEYNLYVNDELNPYSISDQFVYPLLTDHEGGVWVGTFYRGLNYIVPGAGRFREWRPSRFVNSVAGHIISALTEDSDGNIWIGSDDGGLSSYSSSTGHFTHYDVPYTQDGTKVNIHSLYAEQGRLWVGSYARGAGYMENGSWHHLSLSDSDRHYSTYAMLRDSRGIMWVSATEWLTRYDPDSGTLKKVRDLGSWISSIAEDTRGRLWISTQGRGVYCYDPRHDEWVNYRPGAAVGSLSHAHANQVKVSRDGKILVATFDGLNVFDSDSRSFSRMALELPVQMIEALAEGDDGLWIATSKGLSCLHPDGRLESYGAADCLIASQFQPGAALESTDGSLYFGSVTGLCAVSPQVSMPPPAAPEIALTGLDVANATVNVGSRWLPVAPNQLDELKLSGSDNSFSLYFSVLSYTNPSRNRIEYRLDGFDREWIEAGEEGRCTYTNLPPGDYTLYVRGVGQGGGPVPTRSLRVTVLPAWYATIWMKILYALLFAGLCGVVINRVIRRRDRLHRREIERMASNKEKEVYRSKLRFFTTVAHEIRTPVSLIIGPLENVTKAAASLGPKVAEDLDTIDRNSHRLLDLVNQLLDFRKVEQTGRFDDFREVELTALVSGVAERFRSTIEHDGGRLEVVLPDAEILATVDREAVIKMVSNLINNARKYTRDMVRVECALTADGSGVMISVTDNGIGISRHNTEKIFRPFYQILETINDSKGGTGLGLSIVKGVVDAHGGTVKVSSTPGKGATFTVTLPLEQAETEIVSVAEQTPVRAVSAGQPEDKEIPAEHPVDSGKRQTLLVADDNEEMRHFIASHFRDNYEVVEVADGEEAMDALGSHDVDLVICDWMMPRLDGLGVLSRIRADERYSHIPVILLTAKTDNVSRIEGTRTGADVYIEKPFSTGYLTASVRNLLNMRALLRRRYAESPTAPLTELAQTEADDNFLQRLEQLIAANCERPDFSVDDVAAQMGMSRSSLYAKIRSVSGMTPRELIQITRLKRAAALLTGSRFTIAEISQKVGFNSASYFTRCFQKQFGMKPSEYTERYSVGCTAEG